jgi:hypothetical protein
MLAVKMLLILPIKVFLFPLSVMTPINYLLDVHLQILVISDVRKQKLEILYNVHLMKSMPSEPTFLMKVYVQLL